jgi:hypothetical protein
MFLVTKQGVEALEETVSEFLVQLMTGVIDLDTVIKVYDHRDAREDCVIVLHNLEPVMLRREDAQSFRKWYQAQLVGTGSRIPASPPAGSRALNSTAA